MHDDIPLTTGRARRVLDERILPAVHATATPLDTAWHELPGEPIPPASGLALDFEPLSDMRASATYRATVARNLLRKALLELRGAPVSQTRLVPPREVSHAAE